jgi:hypothetical protein
VLCAASPPVSRILELTGLVALLPPPSQAASPPGPG